MQKQSKKQKFEKKIHKPNLQLTELLQQQSIVQFFRNNNPHLHQFLKMKQYRELVQFVSVVPFDDQKNRGYKYPLLACQILMSQHQKNLQMFLSPVSDDQKSVILLVQLLSYFQRENNYILSSYIIKILTPLYLHEPVKIQQILIEKNIVKKMIRFCNSRSVSQFIIKLIVVEFQCLLTVHFNQRKEILNQIINLYEKNQQPEDILAGANHIIYQVINRLFQSKHKQLGRFSQEILKIIEVVIEKNNLNQQELLTVSVMKHLSNFCDEAPFLIKFLVKKIYKELLICCPENMKEGSGKLGMKNLRLLQSLTFLFNHNIIIVEQIIQKCNFIKLLLNIMIKYEWSNMAHIEIQKILNAILKSNKNTFFKYIFTFNFEPILNQIFKKESRGYFGIFMNIFFLFSQHLQKSTQLGVYINQNQKKFVLLLNKFVEQHQNLYMFDLAGYRRSNNYAKPKYDQKQELNKQTQFLQGTDIQLNQLQLKTHDSQQALNQIQDENLVNRSWGLNSQQVQKQ